MQRILRTGAAIFHPTLSALIKHNLRYSTLLTVIYHVGKKKKKGDNTERVAIYSGRVDNSTTEQPSPSYYNRNSLGDKWRLQWSLNEFQTANYDSAKMDNRRRCWHAKRNWFVATERRQDIAYSSCYVDTGALEDQSIIILFFLGQERLQQNAGFHAHDIPDWFREWQFCCRASRHPSTRTKQQTLCWNILEDRFWWNKWRSHRRVGCFTSA